MRIRSIALGVVASAAATGIGLLVGETRILVAALASVLAVLGSALAGGIWAGAAASAVGFLGLNFFFTPPRRTFAVGKTDDLIALAVFAIVVVVAGSLVARIEDQRQRAERREREARSLYAFSSRLLAGGDAHAVLDELASSVRDLFGLEHCEIRSGDAPGDAPVAIPLAAAERELGWLLAWPGPRGFGEQDRHVVSVFARQAAGVLERGLLEGEAREARLAAESGAVRRALLSAVSHELKTPLASIKAAVTGLQAGGLEPGDAAELLKTATEETDRLERLVSNLLDLTRIRSGAIAPDLVSVPVEDLIEEALAATRPALASHRVTVKVRDELPSLRVDPVQCVQVLRNLLENAAKFSPPATEIAVSAARWRDAVEVRVADHGPGIPAAERGAVFEEFYRAGDATASGTGLGLAVARALAAANGGDVRVEETPGGGATFVVRFRTGEP